MDQSITNTHSPNFNPKRRVLWAAVIFSALMGVLVVILHEATPTFPIVRVVSIICISLLVLAWCYFDSLERHQSFDSRFRLVIVVFGLLALFIYLLKSRGLSRGLRSVGIALLFCVGMLMIMLSSAFLFSSIFS
jgi:hypothetical protein